MDQLSPLIIEMDSKVSEWIYNVEKAYLLSCSRCLKNKLGANLFSSDLWAASEVPSVSSISFLNRTLIHPFCSDLNELFNEIQQSVPISRIDSFSCKQDDFLKGEGFFLQKSHDILALDLSSLKSAAIREIAKEPADFHICKASDTSLFVDNILSLTDRSSLVHQAFVELFNRREVENFFVMFRDEIVACASMTMPEKGFVKLNGIFVKDPYRNRGIQKLAIAHRVSVAMEKYPASLAYTIAEANSISSSNCQKIGFKSAGEIKVWQKNQGP